ncbi:hypothetical protein CYMTET_43333 [Cymbomonas tetramitiformis]|uniref:Uncharacterized protein n=1 Tax=Cymbomonas tetramitiformis TaxID=36881 RepID=A0AAE0C3N5_9CHLO|nr:hypothetical protein CYMTET_43334 [Cymbomonas tetramitiformis]KAK3247159.1 hypothetical protein CYMTET_43333 [Cymbomonas tetramitiformis]
MKEELEARLFTLRPSNSRLIQCYMTKQAACNTFLSPFQVTLAKTLYLTALREAAAIGNNGVIVFSRAGYLSDPNLDPSYLGVLTSIGINKATYKPSVKDIKERYFAKFRGKNNDVDSEEL